MKYRAAIVAFWIVMMLCLVRYEAFPEHFSHTLSGYRKLMKRDLLVDDSWARIIFRDSPIGYSHTQMDIDENDPVEHHKIDNHLHLRMQLMGETQDIHAETAIRLSVVQQLQSFEFSLKSRGYSITVEGRRRQGNEFAVTMETGSTKQRMTLEIPDDVIIYSPMTEMELRNLKPGDSLRIRTLDPASLSTVDLLVKSLRKETIEHGGREIATTVLAVDYMGVEALSWIDADGSLIRQETPFGWTIEQCSPEEAFAAVRKSDDRHDVLAGMAIPCSTPIRNPHRNRTLTFRVHGISLGELDFPSSRMVTRDLGEQEFELISHAARLHGSGEPPASQSTLEAFLEPSTWVQSDHAEIREKAREIVSGRTEPLARALALCDWVHDKVRKEMTVSLPSALDVLHTMAGDCNEHTYLFVALARAAGLPARIMVGVAYHEGAFYYHAWPAVYVGHWLEMDPTWGQQAVDATHVPFVSGELASQLQLGKVIGQISFTVVSQDDVGERTTQ